MQANNKNSWNKWNKGFTIFELLVAIMILGLIAGLFVVNLAGQRSKRNMNIAQNELMTYLREVQSYSLSGKTLSVGRPVQYYIIRLPLNATSYVIQAMYLDASNNWKVSDEQKISLPQGVSLSTVKINNTNVSNSCALAVFKAPFAKILLNDGCSPNPLPSQPYSVSGSDDYKKITTFVANSTLLTVSADSTLEVQLKYQNDAASIKKITVNGSTGLIDSK